MGESPPEKLVVMQKLTRELEAYRVPSPAAKAAQQLVTAGREVKPGQMMRFVYMRGKLGIWTLDGAEEFEMWRVDMEWYIQLLEREISILFQEKKSGLVSKISTTQSVYQSAFAFYS